MSLSSPPPLTLITGASLVLPEGLLPRGTLVIEGNRILDISDTPPGGRLLNQENVEIYSGTGCYLTPGLVDLQFNGAFGCDFNHAGIGDIQAVLARLPRFGITSILMTALTAPHLDMMTTINTLEEVMHHQVPHQTRPLGIHIEGPFINPKYRGAHPENSIQHPSLDEVRLLTSPRTRLMTLAPEMDPEGLLTRELVARGIGVSAGHTDADADQICAAMKYGVRSVTHLYNAMRSFHHRDAGIVSLALTEPDLYIQMIGDGVTVHPLALEIAYKCKGPYRSVLTSDAMSLAGQPEGSTCRFAAQQVTSVNGQALNEEGRLAGSISLLDQAVRNLVRWQIAPFADAVMMASTSAAKLLSDNFKDQIGKLTPGFFADLILWDAETLEIKATWIGGKLVYQKQPLPSGR